MLVVISDLHFEEERTDAIPEGGGLLPVAYSRNLPAKVFRSFINHLAQEAIRNQAHSMDLVFAGDVFDLNRTSLWFRANQINLRPYVNNKDVDGDLEEYIKKIVAQIRVEVEVGRSLGAFRLLAEGKYWDKVEKAFPIPVTLHFIPGNHDRLVNSTPAIRQMVRQSLGLPGADEPFPHILTFPEEGVVVRHGHEYDRFNFSIDLSPETTIPFQIPDEAYDEPTFGDYATVDIAARIPYLFRRHHGDDRIRKDESLRTIYLRFLEFDDLRPQRAMFNFLVNIPGRDIGPKVVWRAIEPIIYQLLEELQDDSILGTWLDKLDKEWRLDTIDVVQTALTLRSWRLAGIPLGLAQFISNSIIAGRDDVPPASKLAAKETVIQSADYRFLVAGHTHKPAVELIASDSKGERYYINTGTWRNRLPATPDYDGFGRLRALTYVVFYGPNEDTGLEQLGRKVSSMNYWNGFTQRWYIKD